MKKLLQFIIPIMLLSSSSAFSQNTFVGIIKDSIGDPLVGATIQIKGTNTFVATDENGKFSIDVKETAPFTLIIKSIGYKTQEVQVAEVSSTPLQVILSDDNQLAEVTVTSRRRSELAQDIPIPISVVTGALIEQTGAFNVNRVKELIPTVQLYSSNPRNTTLNIRGLGSTFGLTNDGIDPGVGFYVDGVYFARPAATALDFIDVDQIEVLRGPQGTLFGKNTTAGAFNVTTRKPSFKSGGNFEVSYGNFGYIQAKTSITGPLSKKFAGRLSFSGTQRDGVLYNVSTQKPVNDINNLGVRGQLLFKPSDKFSVTLIGDATQQRPDGYAQVAAGVVETKRAGYRQFNAIIADLGYSLPSQDPFERKVDHNTTWRSGNDLGGLSINLDAKLGPGTLTSTTSWRYWNWDPSNDRDFTGLEVLKLSQATSTHQNWTQEIRYAGEITKRLSGVVGVYLIEQELKSDPYHIEESGKDQWRFSQSSTSALWKTPGLFEGYGIKTKSQLNSLGAAAFANIDWEVFKGFHILPGLRYNHDQKTLDYSRETYGGLQTTNAALLALKRSVYSDQAFNAKAVNNNLSGQITVAYKASQRFNTFATYSTSYKPVGVNLGGLPTANGATLTDLATIRPEYLTHFEVGVKTSPTKGSTLNVVFHNTDVKDFQTQVQTAEIGVNRGYLANAEHVAVLGAEVDASTRISKYFTAYGALAYTKGKYVKFKNAPVPLEETGGASAFKDISGGALPGISKWAGSIGGEITLPTTLFASKGNFFIGSDIYYRSSFSSSPSPSIYLNVDAYSLLNARVGFRATKGLTVFLWGRNILDKDYFEQLLPAAGNAGLYAGVLGDPRTFGATVKYAF